MTADETTTGPASGRPWKRSVLEGVGFGVGVGFLAFMLAAAPIFMLASLDANGQDRSIVRVGLLGIAAPVCAVLALVVAVAVTRWRRGGGDWPQPGGGRGGDGWHDTR